MQTKMDFISRRRVFQGIENLLLARYFEKNNIKSFRELKKLKWNQIVGMINEVNDIDDETKKLYSETIKDLIWLNNKK